MAIIIQYNIIVSGCGKKFIASKELKLGDSFMYKSELKWAMLLNQRFAIEMQKAKKTMIENMPKGFEVELPFFMAYDDAIYGLLRGSFAQSVTIKNKNSYSYTYAQAFKCAKTALKNAGYVLQ